MTVVPPITILLLESEAIEKLESIATMKNSVLIARCESGGKLEYLNIAPATGSEFEVYVCEADGMKKSLDNLLPAVTVGEMNKRRPTAFMLVTNMDQGERFFPDVRQKWHQEMERKLDDLPEEVESGYTFGFSVKVTPNAVSVKAVNPVIEIAMDTKWFKQLASNEKASACQTLDYLDRALITAQHVDSGLQVKSRSAAFVLPKDVVISVLDTVHKVQLKAFQTRKILKQQFDPFDL